VNKQPYGVDLVLANILGNNSQYTEHTINDDINIEIDKKYKNWMLNKKKSARSTYMCVVYDCILGNTYRNKDVNS
jgi:hypothetical protein